MIDSATLKCLETLQTTVDNLKAEGVDPLFIFAALAQVQNNLQHEYGETFAK